MEWVKTKVMQKLRELRVLTDWLLWLLFPKDNGKKATPQAVIWDLCKDETSKLYSRKISSVGDLASAHN